MKITKLLYFVILVLGFLMPIDLFAKPLSPLEASEATLRVTARDNYGTTSMGSAICIQEYQNKYYALTNGHVASPTDNVYVEQFKHGLKSNKIPARVVWSHYIPGSSVDLSIIEVDKRYFRNDELRVIKLAPEDFPLTRNTRIIGAGYPAGMWLKMWEARVTNSTQNILSYNMPPQGGESGSGILVDVPNADGDSDTRLGGIIAWRFPGANNEEYGAGIAISRIWSILRGQAQGDRLAVKYTLAVSHEIVPYVKETICKNCMLPRSEHILKDGQLHCRLCEKHGKMYSEHNLIELGQGGCFPFCQPRPTPPGQPPPQNPEPPYQGPLPTPPNGGNTPTPPPPILDPGDNGPTLLDRLKDALATIETIKAKRLELEEKYKAATDKLEAFEKKMAHPLDQITNGNGETVENVSLTLFGGGIGAWLWNVFILPIVLRRARNIPQRIIDAIKDRKKKIVDQSDEDDGGIQTTTQPSTPPPSTIKLERIQEPVEEDYEEDLIDYLEVAHVGNVDHTHSGTVLHKHEWATKRNDKGQIEYEKPFIETQPPGPIDPVEIKEEPKFQPQPKEYVKNLDPRWVGNTKVKPDNMADKPINVAQIVPPPPPRPEGLPRGREYIHTQPLSKPVAAEELWECWRNLCEEYEKDDRMTVQSMDKLFKGRLRDTYGIKTNQ